MSAPIFHEDFAHCTSVFTDSTGEDGAGSGLADTYAVGFAAGTRIATPMGYVAAERLSAGDRLLTADGRHAGLCWVGFTRVFASGPNAPVRFETGVMDNIRPLRIGQGHRVRVSGWRAELLFDADSVLATARSFVNEIDIIIDESIEEITYVHLMFERHEVVLAENVACETLRVGPDGLNRLVSMEKGALDVHHPQLPESILGTSGGATP